MARREVGREGLMMSVVEGNERGRAQWVATEGRACGLNRREDKVVRLRGQSMRKGRIRLFFFQLCLSLCVHHTSEWPTSPLGDLCSLCRKWELKMWSPSKSSRRCDGEAAREDGRARRAELQNRSSNLFGFFKKNKKNKHVSLYDIMHRNKDMKQFRPLHWGRPVASSQQHMQSFSGFRNAATFWPGFVQASGGK